MKLIYPSRKGSLENALDTYWRSKKWTLPITALAVLMIVLLVPLSRYRVLGLFLKEEVSFSVVDSTTGTPISGALLQFGKVTSITSASGKTTMKIPVGNDTLMVSKQYYKSTADNIFTSLTKSHNSITIRLIATGRQVPVVVINKITGKPVVNAELKALNTDAKTDKDGKATIVLPAGIATQQGTLIADGYNQASAIVQVTNQSVAANTYSLTPAGSVYFLSNLSGKIDVVKTNLDGTNRHTVLAGTGFENQYSTILLASRDWKYLALYAQRSKSGNPEIDLIDNSTGTMSNIDEGDANFTLVGWDGDRFIYQVNRNNVQNWQDGQQALKSFDAPTKRITILAQTTATGNGPYEYMRQLFGDIYILDGKVVYPLGWEASINVFPFRVLNKQATLNSVNLDGSNNVVLKAFSTDSDTQIRSVYITVRPYDSPNSIAFYSPGYPDTYYEYQSGKVTTASDITDQTFNSITYNTYLLSPSGNVTLWSTPADGKNTLNVGDKDGNNANKIAVLSDYNPYGWYTDDYLLVSKNNSVLYVMPASGGTPLLISNYYKPSQSYGGYRGGYGGL